MLRANADFLQIASGRSILVFLLSDIRKADDGVHGRADIMAHIAQKLTPSLISLLLQLNGALQLLVLFLQALSQFQPLRRHLTDNAIVASHQNNNQTTAHNQQPKGHKKPRVIAHEARDANRAAIVQRIFVNQIIQPSCIIVLDALIQNASQLVVRILVNIKVLFIAGHI